MNAALARRYGHASASRAQRQALLALYKAATIGQARFGNPYSHPEVRDAIRALGDPRGYDKPEKRPSGRVPGALYDLVAFMTEGDKSVKARVRRAIKRGLKARARAEHDAAASHR